jgi:lipopolysaccharide transport system ATP-binding protein
MILFFMGSINISNGRFVHITSFISMTGSGEFIMDDFATLSSGMYVRLAFVVTAHLEPETLLVDEVLAVGDASF